MDVVEQADGGTGSRFGDITIGLAGGAALIASLITFVSVWLQLKNYRKPLLQRYVVRILFMVPIYSAASYAALVSLKAASWIDPLRDVYEAFTIYTFLQLLVNFIGGERALIITMHGRPPISHLWPLNHFLPKVDISDPYTFLAIKRGILQYTWLKPLLAIATIIMKATDTYQGGYLGLSSGYLWSGLIYNVSITVSLYALAMFWICMSADLKPFRPMPKFLCIKGIIFASYWQGFFLSILSKVHAIPDDVQGYTRDNLAAAIQDALICFEMPLFAISHWYAFSWKDYADVTISSARMPVQYALRDALGSRDLIEDAKETLRGNKYDYRQFDASDDVLAHEESRQRAARMAQGMRYERGGRGKYWVQKPGEANSQTPLLNESSNDDESDNSQAQKRGKSHGHGYGAMHDDGETLALDDDDERLYNRARTLDFGDWNYPVITAHHATREDRLYRQPHVVTAATNRNILQPTKAHKERRKGKILDIQQSTTKAKQRRKSNEASASASAESGSHEERRSFLGAVREAVAGSNEEGKSLLRRGRDADSRDRDEEEQMRVDLVVEDEEAEDVERVRARKDGDPHWNLSEPRHYVQADPDASPSEEVKQSADRDLPSEDTAQPSHKVASTPPADPDGEGEQWERREYDEETPKGPRTQEEDDLSRNVWDSPGR